MKKKLSLLFLVLGLVLFFSCTDDDPALVGKGEIMEISAENATLDNSKGEATLYIDVPAAESTFSLKVGNWRKPQLFPFWKQFKKKVHDL